MKWFNTFIIVVFVYIAFVPAEEVSNSNQNIPETFVKIPVASPEEAKKLVDLGVQIE